MMFGLLGGGEVNDDAVKLKIFCDNTVKKYLSLNYEQLRSALELDFDNEHRNIEKFDNKCSLTYTELPFFEFMMHPVMKVEVAGNISTIGGRATVFGNKKYFRFMMSIGNDAKYWTCEIVPHPMFPPGAAAKKLVKVMCSKFGVCEPYSMFRVK